MKNKIIAVCLLLFAWLQSTTAQTPTVMWWYDVYDMSFGNAAMADIDKDGYQEIVFSNYRNDSCVYALNAEDGSLLWKRNTGGCNDVAPLITDVDLDDTLDIVLPSSCVAKTFCLNAYNGKIKWQATSAGSDSPPTVADIDNDGFPEIIHGEFGGTVRCLNAENGSLKWVFSVDNNCWIQTEPVLADFDNDGQLDFMVANWSFGTNHKFFAYRANDHQLLWEKDYPGDVMYHGAALADIDSDGKPELAIGSYDGHLYVMNAEDGSLVFDYARAGAVYAGAPVSIGDLDQDGRYEMVYVDYNVISAVSDTGSLKWSYTIPGYATSFRGAALADVNSDAYPDVVFGTSNGKLIALHGINGSEIWQMDLAAHSGFADFEIDHGPVIGDFDKDGDMDIFVVGGHAEYPNTYLNYGRAYDVSANAGNGPEWPMFRRDILRHACLKDSSSAGIIQNPQKNPSFIAYPNPCRGAIYLRIPDDAHSDDQIIISDASGRILKVVGQLTAGSTQRTTLENISAGMLFVHYSGQQINIIKKIFLLPE